jgi:hypothetical protein
MTSCVHSRWGLWYSGTYVPAKDEVTELVDLRELYPSRFIMYFYRLSNDWRLISNQHNQPSVELLPPQHAPVSAATLAPNAQIFLSALLYYCVVPPVLLPDPGRHVRRDQWPVEHLAVCCVRGEFLVHAEWSGVPDAMLANERPVTIFVVRLVGEGKIRSQLRLSRRNGCAHVA